MAFSVEMFLSDYTPAFATQLVLTPQRYSSAAIGGYEQAQIGIKTNSALRLWEALRWLGYYTIIRNDNRNIVWSGKVTTVEVDFGGMQLGFTLDDMANRIKILYSITDANGDTQQGDTDWISDTESQARYGIKEQVQSEGDSDADQAMASLTRALELIGNPVPTPASVGQELGGVVTCKGLWHTTGWRIFNQPGGVVRYEDTGNFEHLLGWGFTDNVIAFEQGQDAIHDLNGRLTDLRKDDHIIVAGAAIAGNNGTVIVEQATTLDGGQQIAHADITFDADDDIKRSAGELGFVQAYQLLRVTGAAVPGNNRYYFAKSDLADDHITVTPNVTTSGGNLGTVLKQGHSVTVTTALTDEFPSNTITLTALGPAVAQSWTMPVDIDWPVAEVYIRVKRVGTPADNLRVTLRADSAGSPAGTNIEAVDILGSTLDDEMQWLKVTFASTFYPVFGTTYWLMVTRSGSNSPTDYYVVELNEDAGYGTLKLWNTVTWIPRAWGDDALTASMPFQIWGKTETTQQILQMLSASSQFFDAFDFLNDSGKYSRLYREANQTAQTELENLLKAGTALDKRLLATVSADRVVHVFAEPDYDESSAPMLDVYNTKHSLLDASGQPYEEGRLPAGQWLTLTGVPTNVDKFVDMSHQFVERAEWDVEAGKLSALEFKGAPNPWDVIKLT